jgi:hypothetical protein
MLTGAMVISFHIEWKSKLCLDEHEITKEKLLISKWNPMGQRGAQR